MRGSTSYVTVGHRARCESCAWQGKPITEATTPKVVHSRNVHAQIHARRFSHRVVLEIQRVFDKRPADA